MAEIRIRNASNELITQAEKIQQHFEMNTITGSLEKLIPQYFVDQQTIKQLEEKNEQLERKNQFYNDRETDVINTINNFKKLMNAIAHNAMSLTKDADQLLKMFAAPKKRSKKKPAAKSGTKKKAKKRSSQRSAISRKKIVPSKKKGGKK